MTVTIYDPTGSVTLIHSAPPTGATGSTGTTGASGVSPDGTKCPPAASIVDSSLVVWSLGALSSAGQAVLKNGTQWAGGSVALLEWIGGKMYGQNNAANGSTWVLITATGYASTTDPNPTGATGLTGSTGPTGSTGLPTTGVLTAKLDFGSGSVANFTMATATDNGAWHGEFTNQHWYTAHDPLFPDWRVQMRIDTDTTGNRLTGVGVRDEFVVEFGRSNAGVPADWPTPYTATFNKDGVVLYTGTPPRNRSFGRWRWPMADRPVVRTPAVLKQRKLIFNYGLSGVSGALAILPWNSTITIPIPMGSYSEDVAQLYGNNAFSQPAMAVAGDHTQIGFLTEAAADYMIRPAAPSLSTLMTEGEWFGQAPMHQRDDATGDMLDVQTGYKGFTEWGGNINEAPASTVTTDIVLDSAHMYPLATAAWLLTDDPYYAEELCFSINWSLMYWRNRRQAAGMPGVGPFYQGRDFAWYLRDVCTAAATIPVVTPIGIQNKAYWTASVADCAKLANEYINPPVGSTLSSSIFRVWPRTTDTAGWMSCWISQAAIYAAMLGFPGWDAIANWSIGMQLAFTNGTSGWPRDWPCPYYFQVDRNWVARGNNGDDWQPGATLPNVWDATTCTSWADLWNYYASGSPSGSPTQWGTDEKEYFYGLSATGPRQFTPDNLNVKQYMYADYGNPAVTIGGVAYPQYVGGTTTGYMLYTTACLSVAASYGVPGAKACYDYMQANMPAIMAYPTPGSMGYPQARFSIDPVAPGNTIELVGSNVMAANDPDPTRTAVYRGGSGFPAILAYSGMAYAPNLGAKGSLVIHGGGDGDYWGNDVHAFDLATETWSRLNNPSTALTGSGLPPLGVGFSVDPLYDAVHGEYGDGTIGTAHTYNHLFVIPGGTNGKGLLIAACQLWAYDHNVTGWAHAFDLGATPGVWSRYSTNAAVNISTPQATCYDAVHNCIWIVATSGWASSITKLDLATRAHTSGIWMPSGNTVNIGDYACACQFPVSGPGQVNGLMLMLAFNGNYQGPQTLQMYAIDTTQPSTTGAVQLTLNGLNLIPATTNGSNSIDWDPVENVAYAYLGPVDIAHVYKITPPASGSWLTGAWTITQITLPSSFSDGLGGGIYSRWRYIPSIGKFALVTAVTDKVALWTPPS